MKAYQHFQDDEWDGPPQEPEPCPKCHAYPCVCEATPPEPYSECGQRPCVCLKEPCDTCGKYPCVCVRRKKAKVKLADGKERNIQHLMVSSYWHPDGTPITAHQFLELLFGKIPEFFKNEAELRKLWSVPETRAKLLQGLAEKGFGLEQLIEIQKIIDAEKSDLFDVLAYVAYAVAPITRKDRANHAQIYINTKFPAKQQAFLNFVLSHYVTEGVHELDSEKLAPLLSLKYQGSISDAVADLGKPEEIGKTFSGFQKYLYEAVG